MNAPVSSPPGNFIWVRSATLDLYRPGRYYAPKDVPLEIVRLDPKMNDLIPVNAKLEKLPEGFAFIEGPLWVPDGYLLFSDPNNNVIYRWTPEGDLSVFRTKSGYTGADIGEYGQPGSNGLVFDPDGRLVLCEHGDRRIARLEADVRFPNGIGFSPTEKTLYVSNADRENAVWYAFDFDEKGALGSRRIFFDGTAWTKTKKGVPDGLKVDEEGNLFATGPGGIYVFAPDGTHLGSFEMGVPTGNCVFGEDARALFITADTAVYRVLLTTRGLGFSAEMRAGAP